MMNSPRKLQSSMGEYSERVNCSIHRFIGPDLEAKNICTKSLTFGVDKV